MAKPSAASRLAATVSPTKLHRKGEERVAVIGPAEQREHRALNDEDQAEGGEDAVDFECVAVGRAAHQRREQDAVDREVQREGRRGTTSASPSKGIDRPAREQPVRAKAAATRNSP